MEQPWAVRGVPREVIRRLKERAGELGMPLGKALALAVQHWLDNALYSPSHAPAPTPDYPDQHIELTINDALERIEAAVQAGLARLARATPPPTVASPLVKQTAPHVLQKVIHPAPPSPPEPLPVKQSVAQAPPLPPGTEPAPPVAPPVKQTVIQHVLHPVDGIEQHHVKQAVAQSPAADGGESLPFGRRLWAIRRRLQWEPWELADAVGVNHATIYFIEGNGPYRQETKEKILAALTCDNPKVLAALLRVKWKESGAELPDWALSMGIEEERLLSLMQPGDAPPVEEDIVGRVKQWLRAQGDPLPQG